MITIDFFIKGYIFVNKLVKLFEKCFKLYLLCVETEKSKEDSISNDESDTETTSNSSSSLSYRPRKGSLQTAVPKQNHYGSFYLRMGAVGKNIFLSF